MGVCCALTTALASDRPTYRRRDTFIYDNGRVERVIKVNGDKIVWASRTGRKFTRDRKFFIPVLERETSSTISKRVIRGGTMRWPLSAGQTATFTSILSTTKKGNDKGKLKRSVQRWHCRVGRKEVVTVPMGTYETFPIRCKSISRTSLRVLRERTWYFAPKVRHYVKRKDVEFRSGRTFEYNLVAKLRGKKAKKSNVRKVLKSL